MWCRRRSSAILRTVHDTVTTSSARIFLTAPHHVADRAEREDAE